MNKEQQVEKVREEIEELLYNENRTPDQAPWFLVHENDSVAEHWSKVSNQILSQSVGRYTLKELIELAIRANAEDGLVVKAADQSLPDNEAWHKKEREFEAYCAGKNEVLADNFVKVKVEE